MSSLVNTGIHKDFVRFTWGKLSLIFDSSLYSRRWKVEFHWHLSHQFSIAFDIYLQILADVKDLVAEAIHHDGPDWHMKHVCPMCTYILKDENMLKFRLLYTMDRNDSLKQVMQQKVEEDAEASTPVPISELPAGLKIPGEALYLSHSYVDTFACNTEVCEAYTLSHHLFTLCRALMVKICAQVIGRIWTNKRCPKHEVFMTKLVYSWLPVDTASPSCWLIWYKVANCE